MINFHFFKKSLLPFIVILCFISCTGCRNYIKNDGYVFGTMYQFTYEDTQGDLHVEISELLASFNNSLSTFNKNSLISRFNKGEDHVVADSFFINVFTKASEVNRISRGAFDITIAPIVNAWGFGFERYGTVTNELIDSLMQFVGMDHVEIKDGSICRKKDGVMLNVSAIAKGYGVDVVASFLKSRGIENYMVDIGGEIVAAGVNAKGREWQIGIDNPKDDTAYKDLEYKLIVQLKGRALATSGNYRNFYIKDGRKYAHTIDPHTGYPVQHSLLSASILADDCMTADAYATTCMVIGLDEAMKLIESQPGIDACFIYQLTDTGILAIASTDGFEKHIVIAF